MMNGLNDAKELLVKHGASGKIFPFTRTALIHSPDIVHVDWIHQYYLRRSKLLTRVQYLLFLLDLWVFRSLFGCKLVWTLHNVMPHDQPNSGLFKKVRVRFAGYCDRIRIFSDSSENRAVEELKISRDKFVVLPEGDYVEYYENEIKADQAKKELGVIGYETTLLFFGSIRPYKGLEILIDEFVKLNRNIALIIAGQCKDLPYANSLRERISGDKRIQFVPKLIHKNEVQVYFNAADIVVLPFKKIENSGSTILAMGFGKPIVGPQKGILPFRLKNQKELLYDSDLSESLNLLSTINKSRLEEFGALNKEELKKYKWIDFSKVFIDL